jgi:hypothetical protein
MENYDIEFKFRLVCASCIGDGYLKAKTTNENTLNQCHYCSQYGPCTSLDPKKMRVHSVLPGKVTTDFDVVS